jgi:adenylosuccinate lyase
VAEFGQTLAGICGTLARIGTEVYELQRPEIGELREPTSSQSVGSITMPHKRNPEASEHLATLSRLVRAQSGVLVEGLEQSHERDGRGWKAEWIALPEICQLTTVAAGLAISLIDGLEIDATRMAANLRAAGVFPHSEHVLMELSARLGKHRAQQVLQEVLHGAAPDIDLAAALAEHGIAAADVRSWLASYATGSAAEMIDAVLATIERTTR